MGSDAGATTAALTAVRVASYALLGYSLFYLAMFIGKWYESTILPNDELKMVLDSADADADGSEDLYIKHSDTSKFIFIGLPILFAAALGGVYEALWKRREASLSNNQQRLGSNGGGSNGNSSAAPEEKEDNRPGIFAFLHNVVHYQYRPLGRYSPWLTVGESAVLFLWIIGMGSQCWQGNLNHGNHFHDIYAPCEDDPSSWCSLFTGEPGPTPNQYRLRMIAVFMGLVCSSHFAIILIPVSRDSKIWSALGVPFERAVLYHAIAGHLAFWSLFMHAFLFVVHWVNYKGWGHAVHESIHVDPNTHGGVDTPMGWMAFICAVPMWITSVNWVRRKYYSLFKLAHWLFIGVFVFSVMHWAPNALYFLGGLTLYIVHVLSRLESWKRWRYWNRWFKPSSAPNANNSLVSVATNDSYTRLVLRNPKGSHKAGNGVSGESARGGSFVYIAVPGALGTDEAHAITVALRGAPPSFPSSSSSSLAVPAEKQALLAKTSDSIANRGAADSDVFTVYIKDLGRWTEALRDTARGAELVGADAPRTLLVDVDGFYGRMQSFHSMKTAEGAGRVVVIAGGSGMTSLMGFIQDWCIAASEGADVPEVHLAWCCRYLSEMELVGEALPSMLASAGTKKDTHFSMSLYCSSSSKAEGNPKSLSVTWPLDPLAYANTTTKKDVIGENYIASSLNHSARVLIGGLAAYGAYILGFYEVDRRGLMNVFHEGAIIFVLMVICIVSSLIVYDWLALLVRKCFRDGTAKERVDRGNSFPQVAGRSSSRGEESKLDADVELSTAVTAVTYEVKPGRVPTEDLLRRESEMAKSKKVGDDFDGGRQRHYSIKVLTSGPNSLVNKVVDEAHAIDWQLFDAEAFSFEF